MSETVTTTPCCATTAVATATKPQPPAGTSPCCGSTPTGRHAGACCEPEAKREAVAAGAGCCSRA